MASSNMQELKLRWNHHQEPLLNSLDQLLASEIFTDVTLSVEGKLLKAHKVLLSAYSPYFQTLLVSTTCEHPVIFFRDVKYEELKGILDFIYKGEALVQSNYISGMFKTAESLQIKGLVDVGWNDEFNSLIQNQQENLSSSNENGKEQKEFLPQNVGNNAMSVSVSGNLPHVTEQVIDNCHTPREKVMEIQVPSTENMNDTTVTHPEVVQNLNETYDFKSPQDEPKTVVVLEAAMDLAFPSSAASAPVEPHHQLSTLKPIRQYTKESLRQALEMVQRGEMGIKPAARAFNIPATTLHHAARRFKISSPMQQGGNQRVKNQQLCVTENGNVQSNTFNKYE